MIRLRTGEESFVRYVVVSTRYSTQPSCFSPTSQKPRASKWLPYPRNGRAEPPEPRGALGSPADEAPHSHSRSCLPYMTSPTARLLCTLISREPPPPKISQAKKPRCLAARFDSPGLRHLKKCSAGFWIPELICARRSVVAASRYSTVHRHIAIKRCRLDPSP